MTTLSSWAQYVDLLKPADRLIDRLAGGPSAEQRRADLYRQFAMNLAQGYFLYFQSTPEHPDWMPFENSVFLAQPNPDAVYYYAPVDGRGVYKIVGDRGSAPVVGFATGKVMIGMGDPPGPGFNNYDLDELKLAPDGTFEVIFSGERPAGYEGNWLYLHPDARFILFRQFAYDWGRERDARLAIERLDVPPLKPPLSPEAVDRGLRELLGGYVERLSRLCIGAVRRTAEAGLVNRFALEDFVDLGNSRSWPQRYWNAVYDFAADEALILETELPESHQYWNVQVIDELWNQVEILYRQSSLNGLQARLDADGRFRAVVAATDPGVPNWLDTGGNLYGMLIGRWYRCDSHPLPTLKRVKLADVRVHLPAETPGVSTKERAAALSRRRLGAQLRRRW